MRPSASYARPWKGRVFPYSNRRVPDAARRVLSKRARNKAACPRLLSGPGFGPYSADTAAVPLRARKDIAPTPEYPALSGNFLDQSAIHWTFQIRDLLSHVQSHGSNLHTAKPHDAVPISYVKLSRFPQEVYDSTKDCYFCSRTRFLSLRKVYLILIVMRFPTA